MAEDSEKKPSYVPIGVALFVGIVVGTLLGSNDDEIRGLARDVEDRIAEVEETTLAIGAGAKETAYEAARELESRVDEVESAAEQGAAELAERLDAVESGAEEAASESVEAVEALNKRIDVLAQQMADIVIASRSGGGSSAAPAETEMGSDAGAEAAPELEGTPLSVGQTAAFGDVRMFLSRIDAEAGQAHVMVVGGGREVVGGSAGPLETGGCTIMFEGVDGATAYFTSDCE